MEYELGIIVEKVSVSSQKVVRRNTRKIYDVERPKSIVDLGLQHAEQIALLEKVQNIEILWRFIKYEWIGIDAYKNWQTFVASVEKIFM